MNRIVFFMLLALIAVGCHALAPDWDWVDFSSGTGNENVTDAACDSQGNIFVVGTFTSTISLGSFTLNCLGSSNTFVGKINEQGVWLWAVSWVGWAYDSPQIAVSNDSILYLTGYYSGTYAIMGNSYVSNGGYDLYLLSLNGDGTFRWFITKGGTGNDASNCLDTDEDGSVYISGYFASSSLVWESYNYPNHGSHDIFVAKVTESGSLVWLNVAFSSYSDVPSSISVRNNNYCIGASTTSIATTYFGTIPVVSDNSGVNPIDGLIGIGNTSTGDWTFATNLWAWGVGYYRQVIVVAAEIDSQNRINVGGSFCQQVHLGSTILYASDIELDGFCGQMRMDGTWNWAYSFNAPGQNNSYCWVEVDSQDNLLVTSDFRNSLSFSSGYTPVSSLGGWDYLAVKISSTGSFLWTKTIQGNSEEIGRVTYNPWGYPIAFGHVSSSPTYFDSLQHNSQGNDLFIAKIDNVNASFSADATTIHTNLPVHFTNTSTCYPLTSQWDFNGDGITDSTDPNPTFIYTTPGFFNVSLTVSDGIHSSTMTKTNYINAILEPETDWMWAIKFGGIGTEKIEDVVTDLDGNIYLTGTFTESVTINSSTYYSMGEEDVFVAKYTQTGQCLWFKSAGGDGFDISSRIVLDIYGNLYIGGCYESSNLQFPGLAPLSGPGNNSNATFYAFVAKIDSAGNWLWRLGAYSNSGAHCEVHDLCCDSEGNLYIGGDYWNNINGAFSYGGGVAYDGFIAKFNLAGQLLWSNNITGASYQLVHSIACGNDSSLLITGQMIGTSTFGPGTFSLTSYGGIDVFVAKIDAITGNWLWVRKGGGTGDEQPVSGGGVFCSSTGDVYVAMTIQSASSNWGNLPVLSLNNTSKGAFISKLSGEGEWLWIQGNSQGTADAKGLAVTDDGYSYYTGYFQGRSFFGEYQLDALGSNDAFVTKLDPYGSIVWSMAAGGTGNDQGNCLKLDTSGSLFVGGYFNGTATFQDATLVSAGGQDGFLARISVVTSDFTADVTLGQVPLTVHFTDLSAGIIDSWDWDFDGDGLTDSTEQNPIWTYNSSGYFNVTLTVTEDAITETTVKPNYIHSYFFDTDFAADITSGFIPLFVNFSDQTDGAIISRNWDFNYDGRIDSEGENPQWTYIFPGQFTVSLADTDPTGSDTEIKTGYITATLNPAITRYVPTQYLTIQAAINASNDGDYIIVADGTYYENLVIEGKNITLASYYFVDGDSTHIANTIIDGSNALNPDQASTLTILPSNGRPVTAPHIVGFTIRNGIGRRIVQNIGGNTIEKRVGGGVYIRQSDPMFTANKIEDNDADDEGGGSYAFQSIPNFGGVVNAAVGVVNPGNNQFYNNHADLGADIYIYGVTTRDAVKVENCGFEVFSAADTTLSNYWANSSVPLSFIGCSGVAAAITSDIYVSTNGSDIVNTGLTPDSPFKTIDHALSRAFGTADNPITIHIASGTYSPSLTGEKYPLQMVKNVSLQGAGQEETFLDAEANADYPGRVLNLDRVEGVTISGLSLMGGFVTLAKNYNGGGIGVIESSVTLHHALIANCSSAGDGAGVYAYDSAFSADSLNVAYNSALGSGGGFASVQSELSLSNSTIEENSVNKNGAGISADSGILSIQDCNIANNQATGYQSKGGGLAVSNTANALIRNNQIKHNKADNGAGLYLQGNSELSLDRNQIRNNLADFNGGGLFVNTTTGLVTNNLISNNTASQRGGALYCYSSPQIINNTIAYNKATLQGGGLYLNGAAPSISNSILWANQSGSIPNQLYLFGETADPSISYCDVQGGQGGIVTSPGNSYSGTWENNLDSEPQFVELPLGAGYYFDSGDFDLQESSPCIDTGDPNTGITLFPLDLDGNARIDNNRIDIGAYEHIFYYGPRIAVNPQQISFGRLNINGMQQSLGLSLTNTGNQPLQIHSLTWENNPSVFTYEFAGLNQDILPGNSITITLSFLPPAIGSYSNNLIINNNSLNQAALMIPVSGIGIDASTTYPSNVQLQVMGDDVQLSWSAVTSDPNGDPYIPDGYIVLYSENADVITDNYFYLDFTEATSYTHNRVAHYRNKMFYRVIAVKDVEVRALKSLAFYAEYKKTITWGKLKSNLRKRY